MEQLEPEKSKVNPEMLRELREAFAQEFESYVTDPRHLSKETDEKILGKIRSGEKLNARGGLLEDILIATASKKFHVYREEDFERIKDEFLT